MGYSEKEPKFTRKRYIELTRLAEELVEWLEIHKIKKNEICKLHHLTQDLLDQSA